MIKLLFTLLIFTNYPCFAAEIAEGKSLKKQFYEAHQKISNITTFSANWIDSFFGNKKLLEKNNNTRIRVYYIVSKKEHEELVYGPAFKLNLHLPNLQKKLQLDIEQSAPNETLTATPESKLATEENVPDNRLRTSLSYFLGKVFKFDIKLSAGAKVEIPVNFFTNFRLSRSFNFSTNWKTRFVSNSFWYQNLGVGQSISFDFDNQLNESFLLRFINEASWLNKDDTINTSHGPSLFQRLSQRRVVSYNVRASYTNRPHYYLNNINVSTVYRQNLSKDFLFYELSPFIDFPKTKNFKKVLGIFFKLEMNFGGTS